MIVFDKCPLIQTMNGIFFGINGCYFRMVRQNLFGQHSEGKEVVHSFGLRATGRGIGRNHEVKMEVVDSKY